MPLLLTVLPYVICGGILWFIVLQCAPIGSSISLWEIISVVFVLGIAQAAWLNIYGSKSWIVELAVYFTALALLLVGVTRLSFVSAFKAAAIYCAVFLGVTTVITMVAER